MKWRKLGLLFAPTGERSWARSHAAVPTADRLDDGTFRVYFATRDATNCSAVGYVDLQLRGAPRIVAEGALPVLIKGELGAFDDSGVMPSWIVNRDGKKYLYYIGWNLGVTVPFRNSIGLASSDDGLRFERVSRGPIVDRDDVDPFFFASSCVLPAQQPAWRMWYLSCQKWVRENDTPKHYYHIKYAESDDGIRWRRAGRIAIDFAHANEYAISRPSVLEMEHGFRMWYSYRASERADTYRIGVAESPDGLTWTRRDDEVGIDVSPGEWDGEMVCYPFVFVSDGNVYMLYNGNGYGKSGFGLARLEQE